MKWQNNVVAVYLIYFNHLVSSSTLVLDIMDQQGDAWNAKYGKTRYLTIVAICFKRQRYQPKTVQKTKYVRTLQIMLMNF